MKSILAIALLLPLAASGETPAFKVHELKPPDGKLAELLAGEAQTAKRLGLRPFVELGATWCKPCRLLKKAIDERNPLIVDALKGADVIRLDLDEWDAQLKDAGLSVKAVPVFFALDDKGKPTGRTIDGGAWGSDTPENMAPPLKAFFSKR
jgi:hypothetical protein